SPTLNPAGDPFGYTLCEAGSSGSAELILEDIAYNLYDYSDGDPADLISLLDEDPETNQGQSTDLDDYDITYYTDSTDAEAGENPIGPGYIASDGDVIYVRVENEETGCYNVNHSGKIIITVESRPDIDPATITVGPVCSDSPGGSQATVDLTQYDDQIGLGQSQTKVVYYANLDDYNNGHPIETPEEALLHQGQTVIAEVVDSETLCGSEEYAKIKIKVET